MGLGTPDDLVRAVGCGVDLFDCVIPTRHGRHGSAFTAHGSLNLRNTRFRADGDPIEPGCPCPACASFSRGYLRHLVTSGEALGPRLLSLHNLAFYMRTLSAARDAIASGGFDAWCTRWLDDFRG